MLTSATGAGSRVLSIAVSLITIPILLRYLGVERYGVWLTISTGAAWLGLLQLGIAPSLINRLSSGALADRSSGRTVTSTAWWLMIAIGLLALIPLLLLFQLAPWPQLFNVSPGPLSDDARGVATVVWISVSIGLVLSIPVAVLRARQEGYIANILEIVGSVARLATLLALVGLQASMVGLAVGFTAVGIAFGLFAALLVFKFRSPELRPALGSIDGRIARSLLGTGASFTTLGLAAMVIGYTDLIVIAQLLGPDQVPAYAVAFSFLTMYVAMELAILDAVWPGYSDAASRGDLTWLVRTHRRVTLLFTVGALVLASLMVLIGQPFIRVWAGPNVVPSMALLVTLGALGVVQAYQLPHGRMLTALGHVRTNSILAVVNAAINLPVSLVLVTWIGLPGAAAGSLLGYLVVGPFVLVKARAAMGAVGGGAITGPSGPGHR